jgi:HSP20 family protein
MVKSRKRSSYEQVRSNMILEAEAILDRFALGGWTPNVDICESAEAVTVRVELPGIDRDDIRVTIQGGMLRIQGIKREAATALERLSYYCLERRYGRFDRQMGLDRIVDASRSRATLVNGILTIEIPRIEDRRGQLFEIAIEGDHHQNSDTKRD